MSDFPVKQDDKINSLAIVVVGLATAAVMWASIVALQAYYEDTEGEIAAQRASNGKADGVRGLKSKQVDNLNKTTYADPSTGTLKRLAIEHAKRVVIRDAKVAGMSMVPTLGRLHCPTILAAVGKPSDGLAVLTPPADCPQPVAAPTPAVPAAPAAPGDPAAPDPAPAGVTPTGVAPVEAAPAAPVTPAPTPGTTP